MCHARKVKHGTAAHSNRHRAAYARDVANETTSLVCLCLRTDRHVVGDLRDAGAREKSGYEDVAVRPVELLRPELLTARSDGEPATVRIIQNHREHTRRVEEREAQPIERAVGSDESRRPHVADDAVALDRLVRHKDTSPQSGTANRRTEQRLWL
jgi:hypothetical protein